MNRDFNELQTVTYNLGLHERSVLERSSQFIQTELHVIAHPGMHSTVCALKEQLLNQYIRQQRYCKPVLGYFKELRIMRGRWFWKCFSTFCVPIDDVMIIKISFMATMFNYFNFFSEKSYFLGNFGMGDGSKYYNTHQPQPLLPRIRGQSEAQIRDIVNSKALSLHVTEF